MKYCLLIALLLQILFIPIMAQDEDSPLIPGRIDDENTKPDYIGVQDPFAPKSPTSPTPVAESKPIEDDAKNIKEDNFETLTKPNETATINSTNTSESWEEELLNGNDDDFKPAPLKIDSSGAEKQKEEVEDQEQQKPQNTATPSMEHAEITATNEPTPEPELTPSPTAIVETVKRTLPNEQIKPSDLITEEVDPWDDPRKKISTTCRLQLERIKKKKIMLDRAEGTQLRLQESLNSKKGDMVKIKEISDKLKIKILDLKKEITVLKEKAIRQGCPGIYL